MDDETNETEYIDADVMIDALTAEAESLEAKAKILRDAAMVLEGVDPDELDQDDPDEDDPEEAVCEVEGVPGKGRCKGEVLTTKPCAKCGAQHSRCEGHGGRRSAAVAHSQVHRK